MPAASVIAACRAATARIAAGDPADGRRIVAAALRRTPDDPNLHYVAGNCALAEGDAGAALDHYRRAVARAPTFVAALVNLGFVLRSRQELGEAKQVLERAVGLEPSSALAWTNLVSCYVNEGEPAAGEAVARAALRRLPDDPVIRWNLALLLLEQGQWSEGWEEYRHRFAAPMLTVPPAARGLRRLDHPDRLAAGDVVLCHGEQGLGDEILFAGALGEFIAVAERRGARVILDPNPRLAGVFARNFAMARRGDGSAVPAPDWSLPIGDLPRFFRTTDDDFPRRRGYLTVDRAAVAGLRRSLAARAAGRPLVGLAWRGGSAYTHAVHRTIPLVDWLPLLRRPALVVSLAYHDAAAEIAATRAAHGVEVVELAEITRADDYERTCELVAALDLVVTVPTSVLHVAGAVGTPCWVVMDQRAAWRECSRDARIPWYPLTHRRFERPKTAGDWGATIAAVAAAFDGRGEESPTQENA